MSGGVQTATETRSGKGHKDENFPVASHLIHPRYRGAILAFYDFVRAGDDIADHGDLHPERKIAMLDGLADALTGKGPPDPEAAPLRRELAEHSEPPTHALELLDAFRMDARKNRYADWDELIHYCRYSAMPVGRFVLDLHGEDPARVWAASDAICAALQILNHLQDCGKDFRNLDRVYVPADALAAAGLTVAALGADRASPALRRVFADLAARTLTLLDEGGVLPRQVADFRLSLETAVIVALARHLTATLVTHDPLSERVHHNKAEYLRIAGAGAARAAFGRLLRPAARPSARMGRA